MVLAPESFDSEVRKTFEQRKYILTQAFLMIDLNAQIIHSCGCGGLTASPLQRMSPSYSIPQKYAFGITGNICQSREASNAAYTVVHGSSISLILVRECS